MIPYTDEVARLLASVLVWSAFLFVMVLALLAATFICAVVFDLVVAAVRWFRSRA